MDGLRGTIVSQVLLIIGMLALIYDRLENPDSTATLIFGIDSYIVFAATVMVVAVTIIGLAFRKRN